MMGIDSSGYGCSFKCTLIQPKTLAIKLLSAAGTG